MNNRIGIVAVVFIVLMSSCKVRDLRTDFTKENISKLNERQGRELLEETYLAMGYDNIENVKTYSAKSLFDWKWPWSWMPLNSFPGNKGKMIKLTFATKSFDGQIEYLEGRKKNKIYGVQSWQSYIISKDESIKQVKGKRRKWGLAAYHYLVEAPMRIRNAKIVRYAGQKEFEGQEYDLVFVTWGKDETHKEHDQFLVYINKETKMTDLMEITINDFYLPMPNSMKDATVRTEREQTKIGAYMPKNIFIQLGKPKRKNKHVYQFSLFDYKFDEISESELYPIKGLEKVGESKEAKR